MLQVYLVTGGYGDDYLASTEVYVAGASAWTEIGALPSPRAYTRVVSIGNTVVIAGG